MAEQLGGNQALRLASFDGGGSGVLAQLFTLCNLMHRIRCELYPQEHDRVVLPCEYFDMMAGADFGGLVVIMLVVLRMTAEAAREAFLKICADVYKNEIENEAERTRVLRNRIEDLLKEQGQPLTLPLLVDDPITTCLGFLLATPTANARTTHKFLTYCSTSTPAEELTVVEAALATCATRSYFLPATIGPLRRQYLSAGLGFGNPTRELLSEALSQFGKDQYVSAIVSFGSGHPGVLPFPSSSSSSSRNQSQPNNLQFYQELLEDCEQTSQEISRQIGNLVGIYFRFSVEQGFQGRKKDFERQGEFGTIASLVDAYLGTHDTERRLDYCVTQVCLGEGITTLERLNHVGGNHESVRELPPITSPFIMRQQPWSKMTNELDSITEGQKSTRVIVITGMPGAGKTWLATRFAQEHYNFFSHVCFIDGQSEATIKADIMHHARSKGGMVYSQATFKDALGFFRGDRSGNCLLFYDNVDKGDLDLVKLLPLGRRGLIIVTSRDRLKGELASESHLHIELDVMTEDEATQTIIQTSRLPNSTENRVAARAVAQELGCLPVALTQAGISMFRCRYSGERYLALYRTHRDRISGEDKAYGAFDISGQRLPPHLLDFLHLMSFMHHSSFPMEAISLAIESGFEAEFFQFTPREAIYQESKDLLKSIFCKNEQWDEGSQSQMVVAIQNCSLGSFTLLPGFQSPFFHMHPLIHKWAMDRIPVHRRPLFKEAATRLAVCATKNPSIWIRLLSHIDSLLWYSAIGPMHVNDRAAFGKVLRKAGRLGDAQGVWMTVKDELNAHRDRTQISSATVNLEMALTIENDLEQRRVLELEAVELYTAALTPSHPQTLRARRCLAETSHRLGDHSAANSLLSDILTELRQQDVVSDLEVARVTKLMADFCFKRGEYGNARVLGEEAQRKLHAILPLHDREVLKAACDLSLTYTCLNLHKDAQVLRQDVLTISKASLGESDEVTLGTTLALVETHISRKQYDEATHLLEPAIALFQEVCGDIWAAETMVRLVKVYMSQSPPRISDAIDLQQQVVKILKASLGDDHVVTLVEMGYLALFYEEQDRLEEAERVLQSIVDVYRRHNKNMPILCYGIMQRIARLYFLQGRFEEAMCALVECVDPYIEEYGPNSVESARIKTDLAATFYQLGDMLEAERPAKEAEQVFAEHIDTHGEDYMDVLNLLDNIQNPGTNHIGRAYGKPTAPVKTGRGVPRIEGLHPRSRSPELRAKHGDQDTAEVGNTNQVGMVQNGVLNNILGYFRS